jgi:hypothetical protein
VAKAIKETVVNNIPKTPNQKRRALLSALLVEDMNNNRNTATDLVHVAQAAGGADAAALIWDPSLRSWASYLMSFRAMLVTLLMSLF